MLRSRHAVWGLVFVAACAAESAPIDDPGMISTAKTLGDQTGDLAQLEEGANESVAQGAVSLVGTTMQSLASQHLSYTATNEAEAPGVDVLAGRQGTTEYSFDGTNLVVVYAASGVTYDVRLAYSASDAGGTAIDGTYVLGVGTDVGGFGAGYDLDVKLNAVSTDADGCVVSGSIDISYSVGVSGLDAIPGLGGLTSQSGRVITTFTACGEVEVTGA